MDGNKDESRSVPTIKCSRKMEIERFECPSDSVNVQTLSFCFRQTLRVDNDDAINNIHYRHYLSI